MLNSAQNLKRIKTSNIQASIHSNCSNQDDPMHEIEREETSPIFRALDPSLNRHQWKPKTILRKPAASVFKRAIDIKGVGTRHEEGYWDHMPQASQGME